MNPSLRILLAGTAVMLLAPIASSPAPSPVKAPPLETLTNLKVGQWIQLEGTPEKDGSILCTEVKLLTGDFLDDDWHLRGLVRSIDAKKHEFTIAKYPVRLKDEVEYEDASDKFRSFSDLRVGMLVKIEGTYMKDGSFLCKGIDDESEKVKKRPGIEKKIQIVGRIERVNPSRSSVTAMGTTFRVSDNTKLKSVIR